ncbi:predicted protein [Nematostella vectensis]|uniref:Uncharacterized protein n=1 Tax=Nematostella vectensis TaxID=45351 RepID=A7T119_NEMVE|nr:predicted protein [Nematostella vectensis]|eukprot:XP_001622448.1 predicted protein [Nematostella vectensis]
MKNHEEHKYQHDYFKIDDYYGYVSNLKTAEKLIEEFETRHTVKFSSFKVDKNVGNGGLGWGWGGCNLLHKNLEVLFHTSKEVIIEFLGRTQRKCVADDSCSQVDLFFIIGNKKYDCQHGKDRNAAAKTSRNKQEDGDFNFKKGQFNAQPTKKKNCPARLILREIIVFPDYKDGDFNFKKGQFNAQPTKKKNCPARLILREIIVFPDYKGSGLSQPVDKRIIKKIEELVKKGCEGHIRNEKTLKDLCQKRTVH